MNIYEIANSAIQVINSNQTITWRQATGSYQKTRGFKKNPEYVDTQVKAQIQPMSSDTLQFIDGLNQQGHSRSVWLYGNVQGVLRSEERGGDLLIFPLENETEPRTWKVIQVIEAWQNYAHVVATLQVDENEEDDNQHSITGNSSISFE